MRRAVVVIDGERSEAGAGDTIVVPPLVDFALGAAGRSPVSALCVLPPGGQAQLATGAPFTPPWAL